MAEDRLEAVSNHWGALCEISRRKHGLRHVTIERAIELQGDLEWCIAEIRALRREVERLHQKLATGA